MKKILLSVSLLLSGSFQVRADLKEELIKGTSQFAIEEAITHGTYYLNRNRDNSSQYAGWIKAVAGSVLMKYADALANKLGLVTKENVESGYYYEEQVAKVRLFGTKIYGSGIMQGASPAKKRTLFKETATIFTVSKVVTPLIINYMSKRLNICKPCTTLAVNASKMALAGMKLSQFEGKDDASSKSFTAILNGVWKDSCIDLATAFRELYLD